jgi:hypothetical protein
MYALRCALALPLLTPRAALSLAVTFNVNLSLAP